MALLELFKMAKSRDNATPLPDYFETPPKNCRGKYIKKMERINGPEIHSIGKSCGVQS